MAIRQEIIGELLKDYKGPEGFLGEVARSPYLMLRVKIYGGEQDRRASDAT